MYLKKWLIAILKVKNVLFLLAGLFFVFVSIADIISLIVYYWGDFNTVLHARSTPESVVLFFLGCLLLMCCFISSYAIKQAAFYSGYFECDLYNSVSYQELGAISGNPSESMPLKMRLLRILYMRNYSFDMENGVEHIKLSSRKIKCSCRNCGAHIDKNEFFAGICPYCKTSDVFASVVTGEKLYSILNEFGKSKSTPKYYVDKNNTLKKVLYGIAFVISASIVFILFCMIMDQAAGYNNPEYLKEVLLSGKSYTSYELIKKEILDTIIWSAFFAMIFLPILVLSIRRILLINTAEYYAEKCAKSKTPFINMSAFGQKSAKSVKKIRRALGTRYLRNCSVEMHRNRLRVALAKKIVKDKCPYCGAPIVGAINDSYTCNFCHRKIMQVIDKSVIS